MVHDFNNNSEAVGVGAVGEEDDTANFNHAPFGGRDADVCHFFGEAVECSMSVWAVEFFR